MARTIKTTIEGALRKIGALAEAEQATADMIEDGKLQLQELIASWSASGLIIPYLSRTVLVGDNTKASYTWGPGGDINSVAPVDVAAVSFVLENSQYALKPGDETLFMGDRLLGNTGSPSWFYFERQTLPILHFDVAPYGGLFKITSTMAMDDTLELTDDLELPPYYTRMIVNNLALEMCPDYDREPSAVLVSVAARSLNIVRSRALSPVPSQTLETPRGGYHRTSDLDYGF